MYLGLSKDTSGNYIIWLGFEKSEEGFLTRVISILRPTSTVQVVTLWYEFEPIKKVLW